MKKTILMAAVTIALATTAAQAEIICTHSGGCYETGMKIIYGDGGGVTSSVQSLNSYRTGKKVKVQLAGPSPSTERERRKKMIYLSKPGAKPRTHVELQHDVEIVVSRWQRRTNVWRG